ncbi:hypothetical protein VPH35_110297 [Triticum aestivum]
MRHSLHRVPTTHDSCDSIFLLNHVVPNIFFETLLQNFGLLQSTPYTILHCFVCAKVLHRRQVCSLCDYPSSANRLLFCRWSNAHARIEHNLKQLSFSLDANRIICK